MTTERKKIVRFDVWYHPVMAQILEASPDVVLQTVARDQPPAVILQALRNCQVYQVPSARDELPRQWCVTEALLRQLPDLLCVSTNGAGFDTVDVEACTHAGVLVVNQSGANAQSVAEATVGLMLDCARRISESDRRLRRDRGFSREDLMGSELCGKSLGLIGIGEIGTRVARIAQALGMQVLAHDPLLSAEQIGQRGATSCTLQSLLQHSDVVSLHCPRLASTLNLMNVSAFAAMRKGAVFINTARGGLHDEVALYDALACGHLGAAGIDVWDQEPPALDHPLLGLENVVGLYHTAGVTREARKRMGAWAAEQILQLLRGEPGPRMVNPQAFEAFRQRLQAKNHRDT
ncbi:hydroxyacid dehydrogenase [Pseudomonas putida]|uniref:hydroxyacid dehydrogenase n=1 Tax=Pseudomonas TaxID=286 RepID=UPI000D347CDC|nr:MULTISPECIES: hydroxyacid dehydrogenase [Pseudomonas]EKT4475213.1 hydroxyacid dehydrogenase [Pseudomonas putida]MCX2708205.1 hydroxyacid dehydrogenase [Pseudomonas sp. DCB_BG]MDD2140821.1 hydroxyacid dehydrogenase [Pseudomonas putida]PTV59764.1 3-phosphoglycerate dehydrogenase [Pseudomonas putida]HDS1725039.1 hydroxyacid dehydrogenase [Pseudomonas putida]